MPLHLERDMSLPLAYPAQR